MEVTGRDPQLQCLQKHENKNRGSLEKCGFTVRQNLIIINVMAIYDITKLVLNKF